MPRQVRTARQIALSFVILYTLASLCLGLGIYVIGERALRDELDARIASEENILTEIHHRQGLKGLQAALARRAARGVNDLGYLLVDRNGQHLGGELEAVPPRPGWQDIMFQDMEESNAARALTVVLPDRNRLTVAMEMAPAEDLRRTSFLFFSLGLCAMLGGGLVGGLLLSRAIRARIDAINDTALAIIGGEMGQRVTEGSRDDEFRRLAVTFNRMLDRNSELIDNLRQVSNDIAHDLRTPVARLRQRLERALALTEEGSPLHREITSAIDQSDAALSLFAAILRIAEVKGGAIQQYFRPIDFSAIVRSLCESYDLAADDSGRSLSCTIANGVILTGDEELLAQAVINILENALRHTPVGTHIAVLLDTPGPDTVRLIVNDDGPGVPDALLPQITRRFVRLDTSRTTSGFGLGLNLAKAIVTSHGGQIAFRNVHPGLLVEITFCKTLLRDGTD